VAPASPVDEVAQGGGTGVPRPPGDVSPRLLGQESAGGRIGEDGGQAAGQGDGVVRPDQAGVQPIGQHLLERRQV
jgi:hypothetical protein